MKPCSAKAMKPWNYCSKCLSVLSYPSRVKKLMLSLVAHGLKCNMCQYIHAQCYVQNAKKANLELCVCQYILYVHMHRHTHTYIYSLYVCVFFISQWSLRKGLEAEYGWQVRKKTPYSFNIETSYLQYFWQLFFITHPHIIHT